MSTPDDTQIEEAFAEFAHAAELMVDPVDSAVIHGRVRRRRTTKSALGAALAALLVAAPAAWWFQESNGEEVDPPPAEETTDEVTSEETDVEDVGDPSVSVPEGGQESGGDELILPTFDDLMGAELELSPFFPNEEGMNDVCPTGPATLGGPEDDEYSGGPLQLRKLVQVPLEEGGPVEAVALISCTYGDSQAAQVVSVAGDGNGGWEVTEEIALGDYSFPVLDIAPAAVTGVLLLVPEPHGLSHSGPLDYEIFRYRTGQELEDVTDSAYMWGITDLAVEVEKSDNGDGTWTATVTVTNTGDHEGRAFELAACADEALTIAEVDDMPDCIVGHQAVGEYDALEPGDSMTEEWTVTPAPFDEWSGDAQAGGAYIEVWVDIPMYGVDGFAFDYDNSNDYGGVALIVDDVT